MKKILIVLIPLMIFLLSTGMNAQEINRISVEKDTVKMGYSTHIFTSVNLEDAKVATTLLLEKVIKDWGKDEIVKVVPTIYDDINKIKTEINRNQLDLIALSTLDYFDMRSKVKIVPFQVYKYENNTLTKMLLICRNDFTFNSIRSLRGKKIIICKTFSGGLNMSLLWLQTLILRNNENYLIDFAPNIFFYDKPLRCVSEVFLKKADAIVLSEKEYEAVKDLNPQFGNQLNIVVNSKPLLYSVFCYHEKLRNHKTFTLDELKTRLEKFHNSKSGRQFLAIFRINSIIPFKPEYLADTDELITEYYKLTKGKKLLN